MNNTERFEQENEKVLFLINQIKQGGSESISASEQLERYFHANVLLIAKSSLKQLATYPIPIDRLVDEGYIGLIYAAYKFDETKHPKFINFASKWIRKKIENFITPNSNFSKNKELINAAEAKLIDQIKQAGVDSLLAKEKLKFYNQRFVIMIAKQYQTNSFPLERLIEEGYIGLIQAALKFDETKGFKFISYAIWWINKQIEDFITSNQNPLKIDGLKRDISVTPEEEVNLILQIKQCEGNSILAAEKLQFYYQQFVRKIAKEYSEYPFSIEKLIDEGNLGLIQAAHEFDETTNLSFINYATVWIDKSIKEFVTSTENIFKLEELKKDAPFTTEEEISLINQIKQGGDDCFSAIDKLKICNQRIVRLIANKYSSYPISLEKLIEEGYNGLLQAAFKYNETNKITFTQLAIWWIYQSIDKFVNSKSALK